MYLTYSRLPTAGAGRSAVEVARLLLEHGADPNAGYLWEGLVPPFTALTGVFGNGEAEPPAHPDWPALARLLLEAGADANDGQALYNLGGDPDERWLVLLLEFGLGRGDGGPWRRLFGERQDSPREMLEDVLMDAGASGAGDEVDALLMVATAGDRDAVDRMLLADPGLRARAIERRPDQLVRAAEKNSFDAVALMIALGFDVNAIDRTAPLHEAAMRGNVKIIRLLLEHGADPNQRDRSYHATPAGWAEHHGQAEAHELLSRLEE